MSTIYRRLGLLLAAALVVGCTAGDTRSSSTTAGPAQTVPTGPAPGVTDDTIKVGVEFVDLAAIGDIVTLDHGDYKRAYKALFDDINAHGGINGRRVDATIVGVNPVGSDSADAAC